MKQFLANDSGILIPGLAATDINFNGMQRGEIHALANDANFDGAHFSEPLTNYVTGLPDEEGLEATLEAIAPMVPSGRSFQYMQANEVAPMQLDTDNKDIREPGAEFALITSKGTRADGRTDNKGLAMALDNDGDDGENPIVQQHYVRAIRNRLLRNDIYRVSALLDANDVSSSTNNWGPTATVENPDKDLLAMVDESFTANGVRPSVVAIGGQAAIRRKLRLMALAAAGGFTNLAMTNEQLAAFLGVKKVVELDVLYQTTPTAKDRIVGSRAYAYFAQQGATRDDASHIKRFVTMTASGRFRVYIIPMMKRTIVAVEHYSRNVAARTVGIKSITPTFT